MEQLGNAIGYVEKLAVCTDACKGLAAAVKQVFPGLSIGSASST